MAKNQEYLEHLYKSASAIYLYDSCPVFDVLASLKHQISGSAEVAYVPLLVPVKTWASFYNSSAKTMLDAMRNATKSLKNGLCLLLVLSRLSKSAIKEEY